MNGKYVFLALFVLCSSWGFGKPDLVMGERAKSFLNKRNQSDSKQLNLKKIDVSKNKTANVVSVDEYSRKTMNEMKKFFSKTYNVHEIKDRVLSIKKDNVKFDLSELESQRALCAHHMLKKIMPVEYVDKFMLVSIDKERSFSEKQGVKIEGYRFNFNRLFNGRVVRSKDDYLRIRTDAKGLLRDARIALQDLKESSEIVKTDENINENETTLDSLVSVELDAIQVIDQNGNEKKERVDKVEVNSVAEAYCEIFVGESKMYFPCLSYASKINLSNDEKISYIIDAPHSRQSWGDYNHEKKGTARFNRRDR